MIGGISSVGSFGMGSVGSFYQSRLTENIRNARSARQPQRGQVQMTARKAASPETPVQPVRAVRPVSRDEASLPELASRLENDAAAMAGRMRTKYGEVNPEGVFVETGKENLSPVQGSRKNVLEGQLAQAEDALAKNDLEAAEGVLNKGAPDIQDLPGQEDGEEIPGLPGQEDGEEIPGLPGQEDEEEVPGLPGQEDEEEVPGLPGQKDEDGEDAQGAESAQEAMEEGECETCEKRKYQDGSDDMGVSFKAPTNIKPEQAASAVRGHEMEHVVREQAKAKREGREVVSQTVTMHTGICPECGKAYVSGGTTQTVTRAAADNSAGQQEDNQRNADQGERKTLTFIPA